MNLSVVIVAFKSEHLLEKLILSIPKNYEIIIIENSLDREIKDKFEKHENVQVVIPKENLGYGKSFNLGLKITKNNFICFLSPDVSIPKGSFENISKIINKIHNFSVLAPTYIDESIHKNYQIKNKNEHREEGIDFGFRELSLGGNCSPSSARKPWAVFQPKNINNHEQIKNQRSGDKKN